jgi:hypothetical protein
MSNAAQLSGNALHEILARREGPVTLADGTGRTFDLRGNRGINIIPGSGATVTYSKVDTLGASEHDTATDATSTSEVFVEKWAFVRVSTASGSARCCVVGP